MMIRQEIGTWKTMYEKDKKQQSEENKAIKKEIRETKEILQKQGQEIRETKEMMRNQQ